MTQSAIEKDTVLGDRYRVERAIGSGGMATVYVADDLKLERQVALKVLRPELAAVLGTERFLAEVKITAGFDHPHILTLIDSGSAAGLLYYVLPLVRGESLRSLIDREGQLGIEQAVAITKQVGSALDYAHGRGIVHRDVKPENVLFQEGAAMLADFGIALAVQESAGNRLTETGLSLGTPSYMSPEQATGERGLDARSDLYSLAAMLYEMLVGEPPFTGKTTHALIAKLLTEPAMHIRTVRNTVPEAVDAAVFKALSKVPADRFASVAEFIRALESAAPIASTIAPVSTTAPAARRFRKAVVFGAIGVVVVAGTAAALAMNGTFTAESTHAVLRDRSQLTSSGNVLISAISPDGKQLAYLTKACADFTCRYALDVQDVGGTATKRIAENISTGYTLQWSPDRRNILFQGGVDGKLGQFLVSALGGTPRLVSSGPTAFYAGGDSLLLGASGGSKKSFTVRIAGLDGVARDSLIVPGPGTSLGSLVAIPGTSRFVAMVVQSGQGLWRVMERDGTVRDTVRNGCLCAAAASHDALWMSLHTRVDAAVVRVALDPKRGTFAHVQDTVYRGKFTTLSVTADGTRMAIDEGTYTFSTIIGSLPDMLAGKNLQGPPLLQSSSAVSAFVSPDGERVLMRRSVTNATGTPESRYSVRAFVGGSETPLSLAGDARVLDWFDSVTVLVGSRTATAARMERVDVRTGKSVATFEIEGTPPAAVVMLDGGGAWIPATRDRIIVDRAGKRYEIEMPSWFEDIRQLEVSADGARLLMAGWGKSTSDTLRVDVVSTVGGTPVPWTRAYAIGGAAYWTADGSIVFRFNREEHVASVRLVAGPGKETTLGNVAHAANGVSLSRDLKRAAITWREQHGDSWMYKLAKQ
jgi:hypothetical protein